MTTIRKARSDDRDALFAIWESAVRATHHFLSEEDCQFFAAMVCDEYLPTACLWCAVDADDRPIGFLGMTGNRIDTLFVAANNHGAGIGSALIVHARRDAPHLLVDVNEQNEGAVAFYRHMGFRPVGRSPLDDSGRPYPILHMALQEGAELHPRL